MPRTRPREASAQANHDGPVQIRADPRGPHRGPTMAPCRYAQTSAAPTWAWAWAWADTPSATARRRCSGTSAPEARASP